MEEISFDIAIILAAYVVNASNLFIYCYFGKIATDSYDGMAHSLYESNWQALPIDLQKCLVLMIGNMQRPVHYHGSGVVMLNLEIFLQVTQ